MKELLGFGARSFSWPENRWQRDVSCYSVWRWWCCDTLLLPVSCHKPIPVLWTGVPIWLTFFSEMTLSVLKFLSLWQRHSESLPNVWGSGRHPPSQRRPSLCGAYCVRSWSSTSSEKGMHHVLLDIPVKGLFFFQRRKSLGSHVLMRNTNIKALWKSLG